MTKEQYAALNLSQFVWCAKRAIERYKQEPTRYHMRVLEVIVASIEMRDGIEVDDNSKTAYDFLVDRLPMYSVS